MKRFFCGNCGEDVDENQELCPYCRAIFTAIKCPRCGYRGKLHEFLNGCPSCDFLGEDRVRVTSHNADDPESEPFPDASLSALKYPPVNRRERPAWLFWLVLAAMIASFVALSIVYTSI